MTRRLYNKHPVAWVASTSAIAIAICGGLACNRINRDFDFILDGKEIWPLEEKITAPLPKKYPLYMTGKTRAMSDPRVLE